MKKHIPIFFSVLLLFGADYGGCFDESIPTQEYILVSSGAKGTVLFEETPGGNAVCNSSLTTGLDVYVRQIKDGGEIIDGRTDVNQNCYSNSIIRRTFKL